MTTLPHTFKRIGSIWPVQGVPAGLDQAGYEFVASTARPYRRRALAGAPRALPRAPVLEGQDDEIGFVVHKPGGPEHGR